MEAPADTQQIRINVGGTIFETSRDTLSRIPYFGNRSADWGETTFIDRDPEGFRAVLNWARDPQYTIPAQWAPEVQYYGLPTRAIDIAPWMARHVPLEFVSRLTSDGRNHIPNVVFYRATTGHANITHIVYKSHTCDTLDIAVANDLLSPHRRDILQSYAASNGMCASVIPQVIGDETDPSVYFDEHVEDIRLAYMPNVCRVIITTGEDATHMACAYRMRPLYLYLYDGRPCKPRNVDSLLWRDYGELPLCVFRLDRQSRSPQGGRAYLINNAHN